MPRRASRAWLLLPTTAVAAAAAMAVVMLWVTVRRSSRRLSGSSSELRGRHSGKNFACFLGHYKREVETEALGEEMPEEILASAAPKNSLVYTDRERERERDTTVRTSTSCIYGDGRLDLKRYWDVLSLSLFVYACTYVCVY